MSILSVISNDGGEKLSSKRMISALLTITVITVVIGQVFFGVKVDENVFNGLIDALIWSVGIVGSEQFAKQIPYLNDRRKKRRDNNPNNETEEDMI